MVPSLYYIVVPMIACVILVITHAYLGLHVLRRGVIFVDIAIAQIAALGLTFSFYMGYDPKSWTGYLFALTFALGGAALFAFARTDEKKIPQEAIIGICYVVAAGCTILLTDMAKDAHGAENIRYLLVGNLSFVVWEDVLRMLAVYVPLGIFHGIFFHKFYMVSFEPQKAEELGISRGLWDFFFYFTFGIAITTSVKVCGVLLVFSFLVIPTVCISLFVDRLLFRLIWGGILGTVVSFVGLLFWERPSGPTIIFFFALAFALCALAKLMITAEHKGKALAKWAAGIFAFISLLFGLTFLKKPEHEEGLHVHTSLEHHHIQSSEELATHNLQKEEKEFIQDLLKKLQKLDPLSSEGDVEKICKECGHKKILELTSTLLKITATEKGENLKLNLARMLLILGKEEGAPYLIEILEKSEGALIRDEALKTLRGMSGKDFGYDPYSSVEENKKALTQWRKWWSEKQGKKQKQKK